MTERHVVVVDTSVAVKWFLPEEHSDNASVLLNGTHRLLAPDLIVAEVGNVLWKRMRALDLTDRQAAAVYEAFLQAPIEITTSRTLAASAFAIAGEAGRTLYDSLYLALALRERAKLVTGDLRFYNALKSGPLGTSLRWVGDVL